MSTGTTTAQRAVRGAAPGGTAPHPNRTAPAAGRAAAVPAVPAPRGLPSGTRRRLTVLVDLVVAAAICLAGFRWGAAWFQVHEARWVAAALHLAGVRGVSGALPAHLLVFRGGAVYTAAVTPACSSVLSVVGLVALTVSILRSRGLHAVVGLVAAVAAVVVGNDLRLAASSLAGLAWGRGALVLFHDWVGTLWNFAATLIGFLLMICLTLPAGERAEQDVAGRHTARRPDAWAVPGLGYRLPEGTGTPGRRRRTLTGLVHRYLLPDPVSRRLAARRETRRIDYRIGLLPADQRVTTVHRLAADGLGAHTASLLALATYDQDPQVLDALADEVARRQWEPVVNGRVASLRMWAHGWTLGRSTAARGTGDDVRDPDPTWAVPPVPPPPAPVAARPPAAPPTFACPPSGDAMPIHRPALSRTVPPVPRPRPPLGTTPAGRARPAVLVTGAGGPAGVAVVRRLVALGHRVVAADADPTAAGGALAPARVTVPRADAPGFADAVLAAAVAGGADALVCTVAEELPALAAAADRLAAAGVGTWLPTSAAVALCTDKAAFALRLRSAGIPGPATAITPSGAAALPGPWIVKPRVGRGSRGVLLPDSGDAAAEALAADPALIAQTRLSGREFTADALVARDGRLLTVVPRWREETRAGISVKGTTFDSAEVTDAVAATLTAVGLTGPANVQGFVADDGAVSVVEVNPRFSGGLPLTLAAGADLVAAHLAGIREPAAELPLLWFTPGVSMSRYLAETFTGPGGVAVPDPCAVAVPA